MGYAENPVGPHQFPINAFAECEQVGRFEDLAASWIGIFTYLMGEWWPIVWILDIDARCRMSDSGGIGQIKPVSHCQRKMRSKAIACTDVIHTLHGMRYCVGTASIAHMAKWK